VSDWTTPEQSAVLLDGESLTSADLAAIAGGAPVFLADEARGRMAIAARWVDDRPEQHVVRLKWRWLAGDPPDEGDPAGLVRAFLLGHCAAVGEPIAPGIVRAVIAARVNVFALGHSGVRPELADVLLALLADDVIPVVPSQGPVGAAGSSVLAHIARVACGWGGEVWRAGERGPAPTDRATVVPTEKEALSLINGATYDAALAGIAVHRAEIALAAAEAACALSFEVMRADLACLSPLAHEARRHSGAIGVADGLRKRLSGSDLVVRRPEPDSFSIRCAPIVLGAAREALAHVRGIVERELNAATDNPLVFPAVDTVEAGNFHGAPIALAMDHLKIALAQVASIAERRVFRLTYGELSGLPSFLLPGNGINNGLMLAQYTAASLTSECKGLAHPASVDSIPTVGHHEDHVPMGAIAARSAIHVIDLVADVIAIELLCAAQGLDFRLSAGAHPGEGTIPVYEAVRALVPRWLDDRVLHPDLRAIGAAVRSGAFR
jgi:histidine ammonia-lyase